jgi:hypothetical protein
VTVQAASVISCQRELARRSGAGLEVTLYWSAADNSTSIELHLVDSDTTFRYAVPADEALEAFYHPFAHLRCAVEP